MSKENAYQGPLAGLNVIDFGHYYAGPMAGMLLADQGANVIRVVRPGKPELPSQQYRLLNRNKKMLTLDLKAKEGKLQALSLIERADVVIENFRPGVMRRLGLDYISLKERNQGLVYLSLPGFASTDRARANIQAWEGVLCAAAGVYTEVSWVRQKLNFPPVYTWAPQCSAHGSIHGAIAVMAALVAREEYGLGTVIETPLVDAGLSAFPNGFVLNRWGKLRSASQTPNEALLGSLKPWKFSSNDSYDVQSEKLRNAHESIHGTLLKFYPCADGRRILFFPTCGADNAWKLLGIDKKIKSKGLFDESPWEASGLKNSLSSLGAEHNLWLSKLLSETFLTKTAEEWETLFSGGGVALLRTRTEWLKLDPMLRSGVLTQLNNGGSSITVPGRLADISGPGGTLISSYQEAEPITMSQVDAFLAERTSAIANSTIQPLVKGDLLKGLKVLDLSNVIAGPTSSYTLAQYGSEVIKADRPGAGLYPSFIPLFLELAQGKRSILTDITTAPGRDIFRRLVSWADVVIHNSVDGTVERLGATLDQIKEINPSAIVCQFSAFGGTWRNKAGWEQRTGQDALVQTVMGSPAHYGTLEEPHTHGAIAGGDVPGGLSLAFSALLGLYQQRKTGYAGEGRSSLVRATSHYQLPFMILENGNSDWGEDHGQFAVGDHWWQRIYACKDGWIYVGTNESRAGEMALTVVGSDAAGVQELEATFIEQSCAFWLDRLGTADIAAHKVLTIDDVCANAIVREANNVEADETAEGAIELQYRKHHPCGVPVITMALNWVRVGENHSWKQLTPAPRLGEHTVEILYELGFSEEDIAELIRIKVSHEYVPEMGSTGAYFFNQRKKNELK